MYVFTPPSSSPPAGSVCPTLPLARAEFREYTRSGTFPEKDRTYFTDLMDAYGGTVRPGYLEGHRTTFRDMIADVVPQLGPYDDRYDLALLASVTSDAEVGWPMCYLNHLVPDAGMAYAVADHGVASAFMALRLAANGVRWDGARRIVVLVMDQSGVPHDGSVPEHLRADQDAVVAMVLDRTGGLASIAPRPTVPIPDSDDIGVRIGRELHAAHETGQPVTLVAGFGLTPHLPDDLRDSAMTASAGRPGTGIWSLFVRGLASWARGERVVLADYDSDLRRLSLCTVDIGCAEGVR